ncbi:MAG: nucleoside/nucleotide kinase family protein [Thermoleophilia bacterium]
MPFTGDTQPDLRQPGTESPDAAPRRIVIVGVCGAGKTLLAEKLSARGFDARTVAQEHSLVATLFLRGEPDAVIYLEASDATVAQRKRSGWEPSLLREQRRRLKLARQKADIVLATDGMDPDRLADEARRRLAELF